jgi:hypothetical protein
VVLGERTFEPMKNYVSQQNGLEEGYELVENPFSPSRQHTGFSFNMESVFNPTEDEFDVNFELVHPP